MLPPARIYLAALCSHKQHCKPPPRDQQELVSCSLPATAQDPMESLSPTAPVMEQLILSASALHAVLEREVLITLCL